MKYLSLNWICLLFVPVLFLSCAEDEPKQIDQEYLDSQEYSSFNQDVIEERLERAKNATMKSLLQQFSECDDSPRIRVPFSMKKEKIISLTEERSVVCSIETNRQSLKLLGKSYFQNQIIRWILLERQTAYQDHKLFATTFHEGKLHSFITVGVYKENPSESIETEIRVRNKGNDLLVTSRTHRHLLYPVDQQNVVTTEYQIGADGSIREL